MREGGGNEREQERMREKVREKERQNLLILSHAVVSRSMKYYRVFTNVTLYSWDVPSCFKHRCFIVHIGMIGRMNLLVHYKKINRLFQLF